MPNPVGKVLDCSAPSRALRGRERVQSAQAVLKVRRTGLAPSLTAPGTRGHGHTREEACLSAGFTRKLMQAYTDSVRPQGVPLSPYLTDGPQLSKHHIRKRTS